MRRKIVLWGSDEKDEKILVALELIDKENKIDIYTFTKEVATEEFYNAMLGDWRNDKEIEFPAHKKIARPLSVSDQILPDDIKVDRTDIVTRAQAEWHFVVLSAKLYQMYKSEVEDLSDTIESLSNYDNKIWTDLKNYWGKVQEQVYEKNLFREHAASLKNKTNELFDKLKVMKKAVDKEFDEVSTKHRETVMTQLADIEDRIEKGMGLKPLFEELKQLQAKIRNMDFTGKHRRQVWDKIDAAFKVVKEKRFGDRGASANSATERLERRYKGLMDAIGKMDRSIRRDKEDQEWQAKRANSTDGQLEMQIRQAKIKMIDERVKSKEEKLEDMMKTKIELEDRIAREKKKEEARKQKAELDKAKAEAAEAAKAKIAEEIKVNAEQNADMADKLEDAATKIAASKAKPKAKVAIPVPPVELPKDMPLVEDKAAPASQSDIVDEAKKTAADVKSKGEKSKSEKSAEEQVEDTIEAAKEKIEEVKEQASSIFDAIAFTVGEAIEDVVDTVKAVAEVVEDKIEDAIEDMKAEEE